MKKPIIAVFAAVACVALGAAVCQRSAEVEDLPAELVKPAVSTEIEARSEENTHIFISEDKPTPIAEVVAESNSRETEIKTEKETETPAPTHTAQQVKPTASSSEPYNGDVRVVDGEKQIYLLGFGWIKDEGGGSVGTVAKDMYENGNKIGVMGGSMTVGNLGDELTGNKVGIMSGGTTVHGKGDINKQVGIMGGDNSAAHETVEPPAAHLEPTGDVMYTVLQPPVTKDSTPPSYKPNGEPYNP